MFNCHCFDKITNPDCTLCNSKGDVQSTTELIECPTTGIPLKVMGETMAGGYTKFNSLTNDQKREVLKKRSHTDFIKNVEERKIALNSQFKAEAQQKFSK